MTPRSRAIAAAAAVLCAGAGAAYALDARGTLADWRDAPPNLEVRTLGGFQFWQDRQVFAGWKIQTNVITGHSRLLDPDDRRHAWGSFDQCRNQFQAIVEEKGLQPRSDHLVLLIHGIASSRKPFDEIEKRLNDVGYDAVAIRYPSTRRSIDEHAVALSALLDSVEGAKTVSFVTHSMGGLVLRMALARPGPWANRIDVGRVLMIAPPSTGSAIAGRLKDNSSFKAVFGEAGQQLAPENAQDIPALDHPFGIIAGDWSWTRDHHPFHGGPNDGAVAVSETALSGAAGTLTVDAPHNGILQASETIAATVRFLRTGRF